MKRILAILAALVLLAAIPLSAMASGYATVNCSDLRVRSYPNFKGLSSDTGVRLNKGAKVYYTATNSTYTTIKLNGVTRYVWTAYLTFSGSGAPSSSKSSTTTKSSAITKGTAYVKTDGSNAVIRGSESTSSKKLGVVVNGGKVTVLSVNGNWCKVRAKTLNNGWQTGYIRTSLLRK